MKKLSILLLLILTFSCEERVQKYDELTQPEREYLRERARLQCIGEYTKPYEDFKETSYDNMIGSTSYQRGQGFYHEFKGPSTTRKVDIRIWKQDPAAATIYFYVTEELDGASSYFLKINKTANDAFINQLLNDQCEKFYKITTGSSGPLKVIYEFNVPNSPERDYYTDTYTLQFAQPAFFARFNKARTIEKKNADGNRVGDISSYTSTLSAKTYDFEGHETATDSNYYSQNYCVPVVDPTSAKWRFSNDTTGNVHSLKLDCTATPTGWDLTIN